MELKHIFLLIALISISVVVTPSIYSIFVSEHSFYDGGNCLKCHSDIESEIDSSDNHMTFTCENCHVGINPNSSDATHGNVIKRRCLDCHNEETVVIDSNNNAKISSIAKNIENTKESHYPFILDAYSNPLMKGEDEACISCHTTKSLKIKMNFADAYTLRAARMIEGGWQMSDYSKSMLYGSPLYVVYNGTDGQHNFPSLAEFRCEKCHARERSQLDNSDYHKTFSCDICHRLEIGYHAANKPSCLGCHFIEVSGADAHYPFVSGTNDSGKKNIACLSCHSNFNNVITFTRPSFVEWDVRNDSGPWLIENIAFGVDKEIKIIKGLGGGEGGGEMHDISLDGDCISCHDDIKDAVASGGHSNEQWKDSHNYAEYADMNLYCKSCHAPDTRTKGGQSPYPAYPFNLPVHGAIKISCVDCHTRPDLRVYINKGMKTPPFDSNKMGGIEDSIVSQNYFVQSYLCIACKNVGSPNPGNGSIHFKMYTEPQVTIYVDGVVQYS